MGGCEELDLPGGQCEKVALMFCSRWWGIRLNSCWSRKEGQAAAQFATWCAPRTLSAVPPIGRRRAGVVTACVNPIAKAWEESGCHGHDRRELENVEI